jgi:biotin carboxyl carrier protein
MIETMRMRTHVNSSRSGLVKEIWIGVGEIVNAEGVLIVVG